MRRFNPEKELNKIRYGHRNKVIVLVFSLLVVSIIGLSFALYEVSNKKELIYSTVGDFSKRDIILSVIVDGEIKTEFPTKEEGKIYTGIECDNKEVNASWDYEAWRLVLSSKLPNKCTVKFESRWKDKSGASYPELYQGMIPVYYKNNKIYIADLNSEWYNYDNHNWANAILIDNDTKKEKFYDENGLLKVNTEVNEEDILQMYVWIPRYRYKLFNTKYTYVDKQIIEIEFENTGIERSMGSNNGEWFTHPAFTFGTTELNGFWMGKFEASDAVDINGRNTSIGEITIIPNKISMVNKTLGQFFNKTRELESITKYNLKPEEIDTHVIKNIEWGAVAYLSESIYGIYNYNGVKDKCYTSECELWLNNTTQGDGLEGDNSYGGGVTGCVGTSMEAEAEWNIKECPSGRRWNTANGYKASTTGNIYGIYDMRGGAWDEVMGFASNLDGSVNYGKSGLSNLERKYYDLYSYNSTDRWNNLGGHLGDATREVLQSARTNFDGCSIAFVTNENPIFARGGCNVTADSGVLRSGEGSGGNTSYYTLRVIITLQSGDK